MENYLDRITSDQDMISSMVGPFFIASLALGVWWLASRALMRRKDSVWLAERREILSGRQDLLLADQLSSAQLLLSMEKRGRPSDRLFLHGAGISCLAVMILMLGYAIFFSPT